MAATPSGLSPASRTGRPMNLAPAAVMYPVASLRPGHLLSVFAGSCLMSGALSAAHAAEPATQAPGIDAGYLVQLVVGLFVVFGAIAFLAWIARRLPGMSATQGVAGGRFRVVAALPLGTRERAVILQAGEKQIVVGITPTTLNTLLVLDEPIAFEVPGSGLAATGNFAQRLRAALGREER